MPLPAHVSPVADDYVPSLRVRGLKAQLRPGPVRAVIIHFTGVGVHTRFVESGAKHGDADPFDTAVRRYANVLGGQDAHYVVGQDGRCVSMVPENRIAYHVGNAGSVRYQNRFWAGGYDWWVKRFPGKRSPRDFAGGNLWYGRSCNANTVGIEVSPHKDRPMDPFSAKAKDKLRVLIRDICMRNNIPFERDYILAHCEAHPISRTDKFGAPYDVKAAQLSIDELLT